MKVLVDTCVWSLAMRRNKSASLSTEEQFLAAALKEAIEDGRVGILGPIRQELLSGIKDVDQFEKLRSSLECFQDEPITTPHYEEAARLFNLCRRRGVECGPVDMQICAVAAHKNWPILTSDGGLKRCIEVLQREREL